MANVRQLRRRIRSVQNTAKVTRAMQMIAASKMRRAQDRAAAARPYASKIREVIAGLTSMSPGDDDIHPLLERRPVRRSLIVHVTPDRGLAGGLPTNMNRATAERVLRAESPVVVITIGRKGRNFFTRTGADIIADYSGMSDRPTVADCSPIVHQVDRMYRAGEVDEVHLAYTHFVNTLIQKPMVEQLLPVDPALLGDAQPTTDFIFEPDAAAVLGALLPRFLETQIYHAVLEAQASEQSARMVAMRNATDAADEMIDTLTLEMNKRRQEGITNELLDLVGGVAALEG